MKLSSELLDSYPPSDPRWASGNAGKSDITLSFYSGKVAKVIGRVEILNMGIFLFGRFGRIHMTFG